MKVEPEMMMEGLQPGPPETTEEPPKVAMFDYPMAELGALVSGALGQSITPAEFRALEPIDQVYAWRVWGSDVGSRLRGPRRSGI